MERGITETVIRQFGMGVHGIIRRHGLSIDAVVPVVTGVGGSVATGSDRL